MEMFFPSSFPRADDNVVKMIPFHTDPRYTVKKYCWFNLKK